MLQNISLFIKFVFFYLFLNLFCLLQVILDVGSYAKDQISIFVKNKGKLVVECLKNLLSSADKTKESSFKRLMSLPLNFDWKNTSSILTSDGVLIITFTEEPESKFHNELIQELISEEEKAKEKDIEIDDKTSNHENVEKGDVKKPIGKEEEKTAKPISRNKLGQRDELEITDCIHLDNSGEFYKDARFDEYRPGIDKYLAIILKENKIELQDFDYWKTYKKYRFSGSLMERFIMSLMGDEKSMVGKFVSKIFKNY